MELIKAVDFGVYTGVPTLMQVDQMYNDGVRLAIIGLWHGTSKNPKAQAQLAVCRQRFHIAGYSFPSYVGGLSPEATIHVSRDIAGGYWNDFKFLALDYEHTLDPRWGTIQDQIKAAVQACFDANMRPIIYTGAWAWEPFYGAVPSVQNIPLWYANYNNQQNVMPPTFGGFKQAVGHQYAGSTTYFGLNVDLNVFDKEFVEMRGNDMASCNDYLRVITILNKAATAIAKQQKPDATTVAELKFLATLWGGS